MDENDDEEEDDDEEDGAGETLPLRNLAAQAERGGSSGLAEVSMRRGSAGGGKWLRTGSLGGDWLTASASVGAGSASSTAAMRGLGGGSGGGSGWAPSSASSASSSDTWLDVS